MWLDKGVLQKQNSLFLSWLNVFLDRAIIRVRSIPNLVHVSRSRPTWQECGSPCGEEPVLQVSLQACSHQYRQQVFTDRSGNRVQCYNNNNYRGFKHKFWWFFSGFLPNSYWIYKEVKCFGSVRYNVWLMRKYGFIKRRKIKRKRIFLFYYRCELWFFVESMRFVLWILRSLPIRM